MALQEEWASRGNWLFRYRGIIPLVILIAGLAVFLWRKSNPAAILQEDLINSANFTYACLLVSLFGLIIRIYTIGYSAPHTSGANVKEQIASVVNTTGAYSMVRHPLYVGNFIMWLGPALLTGNIWFILVFILSYWLYYERIMFAEEQFLRKKFGDPYLEWTYLAPAFIPDFRKFEKPTIPFDWGRVLRKEKNSLAAVFLVFLLFNVLGELVVNGRDFDYVFVVVFLLTVVNYVIIKIWNRRRRIFKSR